MNLKKYKNGYVTFEVHSFKPEKFLNILWKNNVVVENVIKISMTCITIKVSLRFYKIVIYAAKETGSKLKIIKREGVSFLFLKVRKNMALVFGIIIFLSILYYLSLYIWSIHIDTEKYISPYEVRQELKGCGVVPGIKKTDIDVYKVEKNLIRNDSSIMWVRVRENGTVLKVDVKEKVSPPNIVHDDSPCNVIANKDGQIESIYTTAGIAIVKPGEIVKKGDVLIKGEQGSDESTYPVHAKGKVFAKTFYEETKKVSAYKIKRKRTGRKIVNYYIQIAGKKMYLKNNKNNFSSYDKIISDFKIIKKETIYEVNKTRIRGNAKEIINSNYKKIYNEMIQNVDKDDKIVGTKNDYKIVGDDYFVKVVLTLEEEIGVPQKF